MRSFRWLLLLGCATLLPATATAQTDRGFQNVWFWGVKGGISTFSTEAVDNAVAPLAGAEWLITRKRFGLYVSGDYSFFDETTTIEDFSGTPREVTLSNLKRVTVAGLAFPKAYGTVRPYAGLGFAINFIGEAMPTGTFGNSADESFVRAEIAERRDRASLVVMGGLQGQIGRVAPFGQVTVQPSQVGFLLSGRPMYVLEAGIRLNAGSAIER
ncbi:MAG: hypothetical protein M3373_05020 [Gemmatimonadota bacterium]|nr:hypothetical protein [Gemmatimonadota bacterium]